MSAKMRNIYSGKNRGTVRKVKKRNINFMKIKKRNICYGYKDKHLRIRLKKKEKKEKEKRKKRGA